MSKTPLTERETEILARIAIVEYLIAHLFNMEYGAKQ